MNAATGGRALDRRVDRGFPPDTPVDLMTAGQRLAYWVWYARHHQDRNQQLKEELYQQRQSAADRATQHEADLSTAREALHPLQIRTAFALAVLGPVSAARLEDLLEDVVLERYLLPDGSVDLDRVQSRVNHLLTTTTTKENRR